MTKTWNEKKNETTSGKRKTFKHADGAMEKPMSSLLQGNSCLENCFSYQMWK